MSKEWWARVQYFEGNYDVTMPSRCVYCGGAPETISIIKTNYRIQNHTFTRSWKIPYCKKHLALQKHYQKRLKMPGIFTFSVIFTALLSAPFVIDIGNSIFFGLGFTFMGLIGYFGGSLIRFLIKKERIKREPQMMEMHRDSSLGIKIFSYSNCADFVFINELVATEFVLLNKDLIVEF
jgi:hypothetical protein